MTPDLLHALRDSLKLYALGSRAERLSDTAYALPASMAELDQIRAERDEIEERIRRLLKGATTAAGSSPS